MKRIHILAVVVTACAAAPAQAVIGGVSVDPAAVPWYASGFCGGTLVAPDRVVTAAHCVDGLSPTDLRGVVVGGATHEIEHVSMHPRWREANGPENFVWDLAILELSQPVAGVTPATLGTGGEDGPFRIIGSGASSVPGSGAGAESQFGGGLRTTSLRPVGDADCARAYRGYVNAARETFTAASMRCATDPDGKAPFQSGCFGDSGGPLYAGPREAPVLMGVISWGGDRCGADRLPNVFADVVASRSFLADPAPTWAPLTDEPIRITGARRVGGKLTCATGGFDAKPTRIRYDWRFQGRSSQIIGHARTLRVGRGMKGRRVTCFAFPSNAGGETGVPMDARSVVKIG